MLAGQGRLDHGPLQRPAIIAGWLGAEIVKAEPPGQLPAGVVPLSAPAAAGVRAGVIAQAADQAASLGELVTHPGRHDGVAPGHRQPRQRVGQFPAVPSGILGCPLRRGPAGCPVETSLDDRVRLRLGGPRRLPYLREEPVEPHAAIRRSQPVPGSEQVRRCLAESLLLIGEHLQRQAGVQVGVVEPSPPELSVLIMLDQVVIGIAGEGQGVEPERVHRRQLQQTQGGIGGPQVGQVEIDQVVPQQEVGVIGQVVQPVQRRGEAVVRPRIDQGPVGIGPHAGEGVDPLVIPANLQVQRQAARQGTIAQPVE